MMWHTGLINYNKHINLIKRKIMFLRNEVTSWNRVNYTTRLHL